MCLFNDKIQRKSTYIPNGVYRKQPATRTDYIEKLGLQPQKYILAVGRITQEKGFDYLIDSYVQSLPHDFKLVLAGGVDHNSSYSSEISERAQKQNVIMPGYVDGEFLRQLYSHARLFVLPSYNEGLPIAILEAMSYSHPIISTPVGGIPEVVKDHQNGILVEPGNLEQIKEALLFFIKHPEVIENYGQKSYEIVQPYFPENVFLQLKKIYYDLLEK